MKNLNESALGLVKATVLHLLNKWNDKPGLLWVDILDREIPKAMHEMIWAGNLHSFSIRSLSGTGWKYSRILFVRLEKDQPVHHLNLSIDARCNVHIAVDNCEFGLSFVPLPVTALKRRAL